MPLTSGGLIYVGGRYVALPHAEAMSQSVGEVGAPSSAPGGASIDCPVIIRDIKRAYSRMWW